MMKQKSNSISIKISLRIIKCPNQIQRNQNERSRNKTQKRRVLFKEYFRSSYIVVTQAKVQSFRTVDGRSSISKAHINYEKVKAHQNLIKCRKFKKSLNNAHSNLKFHILHGSQLIICKECTSLARLIIWLKKPQNMALQPQERRQRKTAKNSLKEIQNGRIKEIRV